MNINELTAHRFELSVEKNLAIWIALNRSLESNLSS